MPDIILDDLSDAGGSVTESFVFPSEAPSGAPSAPDLGTIKIGDKTAAQLLAEREAMEQALKISEAARQAQEAALRARGGSQTVQPPPTAPAAPELTPEQVYNEFSKMYAEDAAKAVAALQAYNKEQVEKTLAKRMNETYSLMASNAEYEARRMFGDEFEVLGDQIRQVAAQVDPSQLASTKGWSDLVAYVRGLPGNFDKMVERTLSKRKEPAVPGFAPPPPGFTPTVRAPEPSATPSRPASGPFSDPTTEAIFQNFLKSGIVKNREEYLQWSNNG